MEGLTSFLSANNIAAFLMLAIIYYIGEFVGTKTKAWVPSVFVTACLFLFGYWTFFPQDIVTKAGMGPPLGGVLAIMLCITHMGTVISIKQLLEQWKIIAITLAGLVGMIALCWFVAMPIVGREYVIAGLPPLTGGIVAATIMQQAAAEKGLMTASVLAIAMYAIQGFVGYPLTAVLLKREGRRLLAGFRKGEVKSAEGGTVDAEQGNMKVAEVEKKKLIPSAPDKYYTTAFVLGKLMIVALMSNLLSGLTLKMGFQINQAVITLILGIIFTELGFLDKNSLQKAGSFGFLMFVLMVYVFDGLKAASPAMLAEAIGPMAVIIVLGVLGMGILSILVGKFLGVSWEMAFATSLTALYGFPPNQVLTEESVKALAENKEEHAYLLSQMLPQMIVGGFVTVTITSVIIAGVFVNLF